MKTTVAILFNLFITISLFAQKAPIKWGDIPKADLEMTSYAPQPEAEALVLTDYGRIELFLTDEYVGYDKFHHVRTKLFKSSAFDRGTIRIPFYSHSKKELVYNVEAQVILPDGKKIKLSKKDIYEEKINDYWTVKKFAFPSLQEGCVIEYKYVKRSKMIYYLDDWQFQRDIPTRWSELRTITPIWFNYIAFEQGVQANLEQEVLVKRIDLPTAYRNMLDYGSPDDGRGTEVQMVYSSYSLGNIPGLQPEQYITTMNDYYARLWLQLKTIQFPRQQVQNVSSSWDDIAKELASSHQFGHQLTKKKFTKKLMEAISPELVAAKNDQEKVMIIYRYLSNRVTWNEINGYTSNSLDDAFAEGSANSGELNMMLIAVCKQLGIEAFPVLISTRNHGKMMEYYPKTDQFNHLIAYVKTDEKEQLLDIGTPNRHPNYLRVSSLNSRGWLVDGERSQWVNVPVVKDREVTIGEFTLSEDGAFSGTLTKKMTGYSAMYMLENKNLKEKIEKTHSAAKVAEVKYESAIASGKSGVSVETEVTLPEDTKMIGDYISFPALLRFGYTENPLKKEERLFPVDFPYPFSEQVILNIHLPEGYSVDQLPEALKIATPKDGSSYMFSVQEKEGVLKIVSRLSIKQTVFSAEEYETIRKFYEMMVGKQIEQIVLKKVI